jgi:hypothetical protein
MSLTGSFRQHWLKGNLDRDSRSFRFTPSETTGDTGFVTTELSTITTDKNIFVVNPATQDNDKFTLSVWIYPRETNNPQQFYTVYHIMDEDNEISLSYLRLVNRKINFQSFRRRIHHTTDTINYDQWNHILISIDAAANSANDAAHLVVNGTRYTKGTNLSDYSSLSATETLLSSDEDFSFTMGYQPTSVTGGSAYTEGAQFYKGEIYQLYADNKYYDLSNSGNVDKFRSGGSSRPNALLPANPLVLITDRQTFNSGSSTTGTVTKTNISTGTQGIP